MATINCELLADDSVMLEFLDENGRRVELMFGDKQSALRLAGKIARTCGVEILYAQNEEDT